VQPVRACLETHACRGRTLGDDGFQAHGSNLCAARDHRRSGRAFHVSFGFCSHSLCTGSQVVIDYKNVYYKDICLLTRLGTKISGWSHVSTLNCNVCWPLCLAVHVTLEALHEVDGDQQGDYQQQVPQTGHRFRVKLGRKQCAPVACGVYICRDNKHAHFVMLRIYINSAWNTTVPFSWRFLAHMALVARRCNFPFFILKH